jgi:hypothetical protein
MKAIESNYRILPMNYAEQLIGGNSERFGAAANVAYRMNVAEYRRLCPYVREVEEDWGTAPGAINSFGGELLIQGLTLGNIFIGVQPTFGFEGDPMRLMMARSGSPHHGFMAFYTYLSKGLQRRRRHSLRHTRRAGVYARQADRAVRRVLAGSADRRVAQLLHLQRQQPFGRLDRETPLIRRVDLLSNATNRKRRPV